MLRSFLLLRFFLSSGLQKKRLTGRRDANFTGWLDAKQNISTHQQRPRGSSRRQSSRISPKVGVEDRKKKKESDFRGKSEKEARHRSP